MPITSDEEGLKELDVVVKFVHDRADANPMFLAYEGTAKDVREWVLSLVERAKKAE